MPAGAAALELRRKNRELHRAEQDLPKVKWAAFQEQRRREENSAFRFTQKQMQLDKRLSNPDPLIQQFISKLRRCLSRVMKDSGGTEASIIRAAFLNWDADSSGQISPEEFVHALRSLGLVVSLREARVVVKYYDKENNGEMDYHTLVDDVQRGSRHFMDHPDVLSSRPGDTFISDSARPVRRNPKDDPFIMAFLRKLRKKLWIQMRTKGDYERTIIRRGFLHWDRRQSGKLNADEFRGAMLQMNVHLSATEAARIVAFYDPTGHGEMAYGQLVEDVSNGIPSFIEHPESEGKHTLDEADAEDKLIGGRMFTSRPTARSDNAVVERFKMRLRRRLEETTRKVGGTIHSILRESFLFW